MFAAYFMKQPYCCGPKTCVCQRLSAILSPVGLQPQTVYSMLVGFFFAILVPPLYLSLRLLWRRRRALWQRLVGTTVHLAISQVYTIDSLLFRNLSGPDMPAWLLLLQLWLFTALILLFLLWFCHDVVRFLLWTGHRVRRALSRRHSSDAKEAPSATASTPQSPGPDQERRALLRQGVAWCGMTLGAPIVCLGTSAAGLAAGTALPQIYRREVSLPQLPPDLDGFCVAHLTDVHIGPLTSVHWVRELVARTNAISPDLICITGDVTDGRWDYAVACGGTRLDAVRQLAALRARHGVLACTGNHEYYSDYDGWMHMYADVGIHVLHHAVLVLQHGDARLAVAGLDDPMAQGSGRGTARKAAQVLAALPGKTENAVRLVMDHRPSRAAENAAAGADIQLSGHTHGGQCLGMDRIVARANQGFVRGWYRVMGMPLYVSNGVGLWSGFPVRLGVPAEIACIVLRRAL